MFLYATNSNSQSQVIFKKINQFNGLSNGRVNCIAKEKNGFVWIGTTNGLNRYDGANIKVYNKQNSTISANDISDLLIDKTGEIWVATVGGGLNLFIPCENKFEVFKNDPNDSNSVSSNELNTLFEDSKGNLWIGTRNGLSLFNRISKTFTSYTHQSDNTTSLSNNDVKSIFEDSNGNIWVGTFGGGLNKFNYEANTFEHIKSSDFIYALGSLKNNSLLIGTSGDGLLELDINNFQVSKKEFIANEDINIIRCIKNGNDGTLWIGTDGDGVIKVVNANSKKPYVVKYTYDSQLESSISSNAIYDFMEDENDNIWIGTAWNGVDVLDLGKEYELLYANKKGEIPSPVLSVYKNDHTLLMGLDGKGLTILQQNENVIKNYNSKRGNKIGGDYIQYLKKASDDTFWMGTFANGLINLNIKTGNYKQYKHQVDNKNTISNNDVRYVIEDDFSNLWVATWGGGLSYFYTPTKQFESFQNRLGDSLSLSNNNVISIQKEGDLLWVATFGGGINLFDPKTKKFRRYIYKENDVNTISSNYVYSILKDLKDNLWVGTSGEGINLYNRETGKFNRFDENKNIRYQTITAIIEDNNGLIWFSTKQGIFNYNYETNSFNSFTDLLGEYHINAVFKDHKGFLYFGGSKGVIKFNPETIFIKSKNPIVKLTNFKLFNKEVAIGENEILKKDISFAERIILKHNLDVITFEFAALKFPSSFNCEYSIKLENFDKNWRTIGKDRTVTYTNLPAGDYKFKVKSKVIGSVWKDEYTSVNLIVLKPFWLEWWAFIFYAFLVFLSFYFFRKYLVAWEKLKLNLKIEKYTHEKDIELYNIKHQFFTNISHEIRTPVTLILGSVNKLLQSSYLIENQGLNPVNDIKKNSKRLLNLVNELLDFRKLEDSQIKLRIVKDDFVKFCEEIYLSFTDLAIQKNIKYSFEPSNSEMSLWFDKYQMEKVIYNLLSNSFKFSGNGKPIKIEITETSNHVKLQLTDQGVGISNKQLTKIFNRFHQTNDLLNENTKGFGLGLAISKEIIELHDGEIEVESIKGVGSTFVIKLKKGKAHFNEVEIAGKETDSELIENYFSDNVEFLSKRKINIEQGSLITKKATLLIVEDNKEILNYISGLLLEEFHILKAYNGEEGLKIAINELPDLIVSDVMMPVMDGMTLTRNIKSNVQTSHIPIILLTARASSIYKLEGFETGADEYITKPFNEQLLKGRIKNILKNRQLLQQKFKTEEIPLISDLLLNNKDQQFLEKISFLIKENIGSQKLNATFLSASLGMSHSVVYKKLKSLTSLTIQEYIIDFKLKTAKKIITSQNLSVTDVCYMVGYSDRKYFSKLFKQRFGKNPSEYISKK